MSKSSTSLLISLLLLLLSACASGQAEATVTPIRSTEELPTTEVVSEPTAAPDQAVAQVNGEAILESSYLFSLSLYQAALIENGTFLATENVEQVVLDDLIARQLLSQAARAADFSAGPDLVAQRLQAAINAAGGQADYEAWLQKFGLSDAVFQQELAIEIEAGWMRTEIANTVPTHIEQVEARQILLTEAFQAERLLGQLLDGTPFETVAINNDPQGLGYLGWFPRGYLIQPEVEEAAFALQPGDFSQIVESSLGFHLLEILDRDSNRELDFDARLELQRQALAQWIADQRAQSDVQVQMP